jgi:hypothetical protein
VIESWLGTRFSDLVQTVRGNTHSLDNVYMVSFCGVKWPGLEPHDLFKDEILGSYVA